MGQEKSVGQDFVSKETENLKEVNKSLKIKIMVVLKGKHLNIMS